MINPLKNIRWKTKGEIMKTIEQLENEIKQIKDNEKK